MKTQQLVLSHFSELDKLDQFDLDSPQLVIVIGAPQFFENEIEIKKIKSKYFKNSIVVGCSSAGEVADHVVLENKLTLTTFTFQNVQIESQTVQIPKMENSFSAGASLMSHFKNTISAMMIFSPGVDVNGSALIEGLLSTAKTKFPITGGLAGDNARFVKSYTLHNLTILSNQVVGVSLSGNQLVFKHGIYGGWQSFGITRKVSKSQDNILFELDGEKALTVYKKFLGEEAKNLPASGLLFPFAVLNPDQSESGIIRTILGISESDGSLILAGDVEEGGLLKFMHANTDKLVLGAEQAANCAEVHLNFREPGATFIVSCIGRKLVMGNRVDEEIEAVAEILPSKAVNFGFYSYGEISPLAGTLDCKLHNQTMTITYINEKD
jgi:hypothetical protein